MWKSYSLHGQGYPPQRFTKLFQSFCRASSSGNSEEASNAELGEKSVSGRYPQEESKDLLEFSDLQQSRQLGSRLWKRQKVYNSERFRGLRDHRLSAQTIQIFCGAVPPIGEFVLIVLGARTFQIETQKTEENRSFSLNLTRPSADKFLHDYTQNIFRTFVFLFLSICNGRVENL